MKSSGSQNTCSLIDLEITSAKKLVKIIKSNFLNIYEILRKFDPEQAAQFLDRNTFYKNERQKQLGIEEKHSNHNHTGCSHAHTGEIFIPKAQMTQKEEILSELTQNWRIQLDIPELFDYLGERFNNIKRQGLKDWNSEAEAFVLQEVLKTGVNFFYHSKMVKELAKKSTNYSTDHLLIANPSQFEKLFPKHQLTSVPRELLKPMFKCEKNPGGEDRRIIFENSVFQIEKFLDNYDDTEKLISELFFLETDGRFEKKVVNLVEQEEKFLRMNFGSINKDLFPG